MEGSVLCSANYVPLSPLSFLLRAAAVYGDHASVIYGETRFTWRETRDRSLRLASVLSVLEVSRGDVVAVLAPNIPAMYELHFGVPMAGAILCTLNTRHNSSMLSILLRHSGAKVIFVDHEFLELAQGALQLLSKKQGRVPHLIVIREPGESASLEENHYENLLSSANPQFDIKWPLNECDPICINYTSGTTSRPKGVIFSHRGAYLNSIAVVLLNDIHSMSVYLWVVPMFHCNGWCLTWGIAAQGGTNVCIRNVSSWIIFHSISLHKVTHMSAAPTVLSMITHAPASLRKPLPGRVNVLTGGAPPPPEVLSLMERLGFHVIHSYGLTETYGPATVCTWHPEWDSLPLEDRARLKSRQGLQHHLLEEVDVKDPVTMKSVPADGKTMGEVMLRGNTVMCGYYRDVEETKKAFAGGWFRSGDLAVRQPDGYIKLKDRAKDIVISGGENVSTIEVESVLFDHPAVLEAAVVGRPDEHWGETPCAFVKLKEGSCASSEELIKFCRAKLPHYMAPKTVIFEDLPKTSTGKVQKFVLREKAKTLGSLLQEGGE
ncbi:hypothetical protein HPP92_008375 [Vanilla planifolia]|uniref:4-coumarate--CoA ligase n=1 Tax=Vanilla planifolia TaxID=51239 RepID=A0A835R2D5_VANPL|nr:hypothetical protein HPP92_008375 [Vanilla planifolia]